jgi:hypothetical protein
MTIQPWARVTAIDVERIVRRDCAGDQAAEIG